MAFDMKSLGAQLNIACRDLSVYRFFVAGEDFACDGDDGLRRTSLGRLVKLYIRVNNDLRQAVMVSQVDEQRVGVFAFAVNPTGKFGGFADMGLA